jgi:hypothetical protein
MDIFKFLILTITCPKLIAIWNAGTEQCYTKIEGLLLRKFRPFWSIVIKLKDGTLWPRFR